MSDVPEGQGWWQASDGRWYPPERFGPITGAEAPGAPVLCTVGDMAVTGTEVRTPGRTVPLRGTTWTVANLTTTSTGIPNWAIALAIIFALACLLGLLFLLVKEERTTGSMQVAVQADGFYHVTQVPVTSMAQVVDVENRVNYIRSLAASAP